MQIKNAVALVTGANRGIGRAFVEALLEQGVGRVYAAARRPADLEAVVSLDNKRVIPVQLDVTKQSELAHAAAVAKEVNLLINNAGVAHFGSVLDTPPEEVARNLDVNFYGPFNATRAFAPALIENKGAVVNILTIASLAGIPGLGAYSASKAAAWSLTQSLRGDLSKHGVRVFGVFPAGVDTDMVRGFEFSKASPRAVVDEALKGVESDIEDIFPDPISRQTYEAWRADHKAVERQFVSMF
jgi:NAD(P)-dependent dehydrogenase (short-subunit alcohol dehydrogenase family)